MSLRFGVGRKRGGFVSPRRKPPEELSQYLLFSSFRQRGQFWLAGRKDFALSGELQFQGGGRVTLHLDGHFDQDRGLHFNKPESVIWGQLNDGALCCILGYYGTVEEIRGVSTFSITTLRGECFIGGATFETRDSVRFRRLRVKFSHLDEWFSPPYRLDYQDLFTKVQIWRDEHPLVCRIPDAGFLIKSEVSYSYPVSPSLVEIKLRSSQYIVIESDEEKSLDWFLDKVRILRDFFSFVIGRPVYTLELMAELPAAEGGEKNSQPPRQIPIVLPVDVPEIYDNHPLDFLTLADHLEGFLPELLREWFHKSDRYATAFRLYLSLMYGNGMYEETVFLNITQALEHLHAEIFPDRSRYCSKTHWRRLLRWFREDFPADILPIPEIEHSFANRNDFVDFLAKRMGFLNKFSLQSRLEDLVNGVPGATLSFVCGDPPNLAVYRPQFISEAVKTRHYLTHFDKEGKKGVASEHRLRELCA